MALDFHEAVVESLLSPMLAKVDATPQNLTRSHLRAMRPGLLELVALVFPADREAITARLEELLTDPEPS